ncbi:hypothetical protein DESC_720272 [Desulfosarcina cetonica]|nr:hypothetical protein DESC_720272 [Desulfosarcina cetonica]
MVAHKPDDQRARHNGQNAVGGQKPPIQAGGTDGTGHGGDDGFGRGNGQRTGEKQFDPAEHEAEKCRHPHAGADQRQKQGEEKAGKRIPVDEGRFVNLFGNAGHKPFQNPHRQRNVEQAVGQGHGDMGVDQPEGGVQLKIGQQENRWRGHAVGQQPEKHLPVPEKFIAREGIRRRQGKGQGDDRVETDINHGVDVTRVPGRIGEDLDIILERQVLRIEGESTQDVRVAAQGHVQHPVDGYRDQHEIENQGGGFDLHDAFSPLPTFRRAW